LKIAVKIIKRDINEAKQYFLDYPAADPAHAEHRSQPVGLMK
jgi:hypothetical protein